MRPHRRGVINEDKDNGIQENERPFPKPPATTVADGDIAAIVNGYHGAPFNVLGLHADLGE